MIDITDKNKDVDGMMNNQKVAMDDDDVIDSTSVNACNHDSSNDGDSSSYKLPPVYEDWYDIDINMMNNINNNNNCSCNNKTYNSDDEKEWVDYLAAKRANMKDKSQSYTAYVPKRTNQESVSSSSSSSSSSSKAVKGGNIDESEISCIITKETSNDNVKVRNEDDYDNDKSNVIHATAVASSAMYIDNDDNDDRNGSYNENSTATIFKNDYFETEYEFEQYLQLLQLEEERHSKKQQQHHYQQQQQQHSSQEQYHRDTNVAVAIAYCQPSSLSTSSYSSASTVAAVIAIPIASEEDEGRFQDNYRHHHHYHADGSNGRQRKDGKINRQVVNKFDALAFDDSDGDDDDDDT